MKKEKSKPTLHQPETYHIKVPGILDESWADWVDDMTVTMEGKSATTVTTLISTMDQAALQGLLRRLYSLGIPLISVNCVDNE